jgi:hypothetical protein
MFQIKSISSAIDFIGSLIIAFFCTRAFIQILFGKLDKDIHLVKKIVANGAIFGLTFKSAGTLLNAIELRSWNEIFIFAAVLSLRTLLKAEFQWGESFNQSPQQGSSIERSI